MVRSRKQCSAYCGRSKSSSKVLPCGHSIHFSCLWKWHLTSRDHRNSTTCPTCRGTIYDYKPDYQKTKERISMIYESHKTLLDSAFCLQQKAEMRLVHDYMILTLHWLEDLTARRFKNIVH